MKIKLQIVCQIVSVMLLSFGILSCSIHRCYEDDFITPLPPIKPSMEQLELINRLAVANSNHKN